MVYELEPTQTDSFGQRVVKRYDLPSDYEPPLIMVDVDSDGYTAEWEVELDLSDFEALVHDHMDLHGAFAIASFEPEGEEGFSVENEAWVVFDQDDLPYEDCTYLVVKTDEYDLAWEYWEDLNRLMVNVDGHDTGVLEDIYQESIKDSLIPESLKIDSLEDARQAIERES